MFIGIDLGHTNLKTVAYDSDWAVVAERSVECGMEHPGENRHEIPIGQRWDSVIDSLDRLTDAMPDHGEVDAIGLAGGGGGLYPLDSDEQPFMNGISLLDGRAKRIRDRWKDDGTYRRISQITGVPIPPGAALLSLRWLKETEPERFDRIEHVLNLKDVVRFRLTGEHALEISDATFSFTNHRTQRYDDRLLELAGIREIRSALPELLDTSYEIAGRTTADIERRTGIAEGTPVVAGSHDACANTLGVGGIEENVVTTVGGTWSLSTMVRRDPVVDLDRWCCENFLEGGTWMLEISHPAGTISLNWFVDEFFSEERRRAERDGDTVWSVLEETIEDVRTDVVFHPFLFGNPYGYLYRDTASGSFTGLTSGAGREEMLRAVYEAVAFMHRWQIEQFDEQFGVEEVRFTGGTAKSPFWAQLFADVLDTTVAVTDKEESGCFGAAMLAAIGVGELDGLEATIDLVNVTDEFRPTGRDYDRKYRAFRDLTTRLEDVWGRHRTLREERE